MKPAVHEELIEGALARERGAVARLVSLFQDRREGAAERRAAILAALDEGGVSQAPVLGITGTPGSGKSSLIGRIAGEMLGADDELGLAVLAVDPSSHISGGALLGDRTRLRLDGRGERLFFRSEASATELGGLSPSTFQVSRLLVRLYDAVIVETVGIGQSEADIRWLADRVLLVVSPLGGDEIQFLKAGIIEIPDAFVVNKCDVPSAHESYAQLRSALWLARPFDADKLEIYRASARTGLGIDALAGEVRRLIDSGPTATLAEREPHFLERWVRDEWGRRGAEKLERQFGTAAKLIADAGGFDAAQERFSELAES
ncbi:MAG: hypothetical protein U0R24_13370 [Solirubrobacterales bacterium]